MSTNRDDILTAAANGNAAALEFLRVFARRAHWVDDLVDGLPADISDPPRSTPTAYQMAGQEVEWLLCLASNPFFVQFRAQLVPAMVLALNAWVDSESVDWDSTDIKDVLKGQWHEVVWLVAFLTGGWTHMKAISSYRREYQLEPVNGAARACRHTDAKKEINGQPV